MRLIALSFLTVLFAVYPTDANSGTAFSYQGQLGHGGSPHEGQVEMVFSLWDAETSGTQIGTDLVKSVAVSEGLFQVELDFGDQPFGSGLWLEVSVDGSSLAPRQPITATPHALSAAALDHPLGASEVDDSDIQLRVAGSCPLGQAIRVVGANGMVACQTAGGSKWDGVAGDAIHHDGKVGVGVIPTADFHVAGIRAILPGLRLERLQGGYVNIIGAPEHNSVSADAFGATISGGGVPSLPNSALGEFDTVGGGLGNTAGKFTHGVTTASTVSGGQENTAGGYHSTVGGGQENEAIGTNSTVGGGQGNFAAEIYATVGGGSGNEASASSATVAGGQSNVASSLRSTIGGGFANTASNDNAAVGGGQFNLASGDKSTISGGSSNSATAIGASVGGGENNEASLNYSTVAGGLNNVASGGAAMVPGGIANTATGNYSLAAGRQAKANHHGAFVWADSTDADFVSTGTDQFIVRANGGVGFGEAPSDYVVINTPFGTQDGDYSFGTGALRVRIDGATRFRVLGNGGVAIGSSYQTSGVPERGMRVSGVVELASLGAGGSTSLCRNGDGAIASCSSSSRYKRAITDLEAAGALIERLRPVRFYWRDSEIEDFGLVAEEVAAIEPRLVTFNDDGRIEGVKYRQLSAVLTRALQEQRHDIDRMREEIDALKHELEQTRNLVRHSAGRIKTAHEAGIESSKH